MSLNRPFTLWLTGLPCSGKTTLSRELTARLVARGIETRILDGDELRRTVSADLGYSDADRREQVRRTSVLAADLMKAGSCVVVALVSPSRQARADAKRLIGNCVEVYLRCPLSRCEARDVKGMYRKARAGQIRDFTGIASGYEEPESPDVAVDTDRSDPGACADAILAYLSARGMC